MLVHPCSSSKTHLSHEPRVVLGRDLHQRGRGADEQDQQVGDRQVQQEQVGRATKQLVRQDDLRGKKKNSNI